MRLQSDLGNAHANLGQVYLAQNQFAEAEVAYRRVLELRHDDPKVFNKLGGLLKRAGSLSEAEAAYRDALKISPDHAQTYMNLANLLKETGRRVAAEAAYRKVCARSLSDIAFNHRLHCAVRFAMSRPSALMIWRPLDARPHLPPL